MPYAIYITYSPPLQLWHPISYYEERTVMHARQLSGEKADIVTLYWLHFWRQSAYEPPRPPIS